MLLKLSQLRLSQFAPALAPEGSDQDLPAAQAMEIFASFEKSTCSPSASRCPAAPRSRDPAWSRLPEIIISGREP